MNRLVSILTLLGVTAVISGCSSGLKSLRPVESMDLERFMGDWYVIAFIPLRAEKNATNAVENYTLRNDGNVDIRYTFNENSPAGKSKEYNAKGFVQDRQIASEWKVQFFWPLRFSYLVIDLADDYSFTAIGVPSRKYLWIMARQPQLPDEEYSGILNRVESKGYDISKLKLVEQTWNER